MENQILSGALDAVVVQLAFGQQAKKPNTLVIWGDDIGTWNTSFWSRGMMGYETPNIDRIAKEGVPLPTTTASSPRSWAATCPSAPA